MKISKRFQKYVDEKNFFPRLMGGDLIEFPLNQKDIDQLVGKLSSDLSPENLACDGERPHNQVISRGKMLNGVYKDLANYAGDNGFAIGDLYY